MNEPESKSETTEKTLRKNTQTITIGNEDVPPGTHKTIQLPLVPMYTHTIVPMTVHVINGKWEGPRLFVNAAIHGDEINGVEIIRRLLKSKQLQRLRGTLIAIPIVNVYGFLNNSRYLPDGRDLNRSFPGSPKGSLASRIAHTFLKEIILKSTHGIDIHTGARHRSNLPQIRADLSSEEVAKMASAFDVPLLINSTLRDGSLRDVADEKNIPVILYEAGEALRFDELSIRGGVRGVLNVMRSLQMLPARTTKSKETGDAETKKTKAKSPVISKNTSWVRAPISGVLRSLVPLGAKVEEGSALGMIGDPMGTQEKVVKADGAGIVIGRTFLPLVHEGEALFHIAYYERKLDSVFDKVEAFHEKFEPEVIREAPENPKDAPIQ